MHLITSTQAAYLALAHLRLLEVEEFWVLALHSNKRMIARERVFRGTVDACPVFPRDVFRAACRLNAASVVVGHNHPSGEADPSEEDRAITRRLIEAGALLGIPLIDHLIVTDDRYWSFAGNRAYRVPSGSPLLTPSPLSGPAPGAPTALGRRR